MYGVYRRSGGHAVRGERSERASERERERKREARVLLLHVITLDRMHASVRPSMVLVSV